MNEFRHAGLKALLVAMWIMVISAAGGQTLDLPARPADAMGGLEFAKTIANLERDDREDRIFDEIARGNVPEFERKLCPVSVAAVEQGKTNRATFYVIPDYLAVGSDADYFLMPLSPVTAQRVADFTHCSLPTRKMVDEIQRAAEVKLEPSPIPPSPAMVTLPVFMQHNETVLKQRGEQLPAHPLGALVSGDKKDVVISGRLATNIGKVAIYGWHKSDGRAIQPLYLGHADFYADYSHGIRLVQERLIVNGHEGTVAGVLSDAGVAGLLSDEGAFTAARYATNYHSPAAHAHSSTVAAVTNAPARKVSLAEAVPGAFGEKTISYGIEPEVRAMINLPGNLDKSKPLKLIFFTLPNGNTIEQTVGHVTKPEEDWHYNIQHIGAQTRFLRERLRDFNIVVVYLEAGMKSWPAWRKKHADVPQRIPEIVRSIEQMFSGFGMKVTLSGHSGGGSFIFGYINAVDKIPGSIERIAFLDSNYAYESDAKHAEKFTQWLRASDDHCLIVLAYNDAVALLNGKTFVSAAGGTWGRTHRMIADMDPEFHFETRTNGVFESYKALDGRFQLLCRENPEKKIYHTVQVELNGFIHCMLAGTTNENQGYQYFGERAYTKWISEE